VTTTPSAWHGTFSLAKESQRIRTAIGLHPQLAAERQKELYLFDEILPSTRYVGEVGLDGGEEYRSTWQAQVDVFTHVLDACTKAGGKIISLHSRRATSAVLDLLERWPESGTPVLHWFSGSTTELERAKKLGCWFSVGPAMLVSKKGQDLAKRIPADRILTETDGPFAQFNKQQLKPWDVEIAVRQLAQLWGVSQSDAQKQLADNLRQLTLPQLST